MSEPPETHLSPVSPTTAAGRSTRMAIEASSYTTTRSASPSHSSENPSIQDLEVNVESSLGATFHCSYSEIHDAETELEALRRQQLHAAFTHTRSPDLNSQSLVPGTAAALATRMSLENASYTTTADPSRSGSPPLASSHVFNANDSHRDPPDTLAIHAADDKLEELRRLRIQVLQGIQNETTALDDENSTKSNVQLTEVRDRGDAMPERGLGSSKREPVHRNDELIKPTIEYDKPEINHVSK